jgi:hypothetical protein
MWVGPGPWVDAIVENPSLNDVDAGVLRVPARPRVTSPRAACLDVLTALGKNGGGYGPPSSSDEAAMITSIWLQAEAIHTVVLLAPHRWNLRCIDSIRTVCQTSGARLVIAATSPPTDPLRNYLEDRYGPAQTRTDLTGDRPCPPALRSPYSQLRRCRMPHIAASALLQWVGAEPEDVLDLGHDALPFNADWLHTAKGRHELPPGGRRLLWAQQLFSQAHGQTRLLTTGGSRFTAADFRYSAMVSTREADVVPIAVPS